MSLLTSAQTSSILFKIGIDNNKLPNALSDEEVLILANQMNVFQSSSYLPVSESLHHVINLDNAIISASNSQSLKGFELQAQLAQESYFKADFIEGTSFIHSAFGSLTKTDSVENVISMDVIKKEIDSFREDGKLLIEEIIYEVSASDDNLGTPVDWIPGFFQV